MGDEHVRTEAFRGASFREADLRGATFRDSDLRGVRISSSWVDDLRITGFDGRAGSVWVDDVDVSDLVAAELDRRHPERLQLRAVRTADDVRAMWAALDELWAQTLVRAEQLPEQARHERVDGEWSLVQTLRHLVFAVDSWVGQVLTDPPAEYHPLGLPPTDMDVEVFADRGIDPSADPSWAEAVAAHQHRRAWVRDTFAGLRDEDLPQVRRAVLDPGGEPEQVTVEHAGRVVLREHCEHRRFAVRDLAVLEGGRGSHP